MRKLCAWLGVATLMVLFAATPARAQANDPLKPYVLLVMDTSGSMDSATGAGPTSCGGNDTRRDHAKCAIRNIVNSFGDMVFALGRFRMAMGGTFPSCTLSGAGTSGGSTCNGTANMFELLAPLDGDNAKSARWVDGTINTCTAAGTDPEIWETEGNTPIAGSLVGAKQYWLGLQAPSQTIWPAGSPGFDPIANDPTNTAFLARPGTGTSVCNSNIATCNNNPGCTGPNCCCLEQCRPYIVIMLTDGDETCVAFDPNATNAATSLLSTDKTIGGVTRRYRVETKAIGLGKPLGDAEIEALAQAGGSPNVAGNEGYYAQDEADLQLAISDILKDAIRTELCNNLDDDCDTIIDEGFTKGVTCSNNLLGACRVTGTTQCRADGAGTQCSAGREPECLNAANGTACTVTTATTPNKAGTCQNQVCIPTAAPSEVPFGCNNQDDDCDGRIDEGVGSCTCNPVGETCNTMDDDCDGQIDENLTRPCGTGTCQGVETCNPATGTYGGCTAATPGIETCNGLDDNCDGNADGFTVECSNMSGGFPALDPRNNPGATHTPPTGCELLGAQCICNPGMRTCPLNGNGTFTACTGEITPRAEVCNNLDDDCDGRVDEAPPVTCTTNAQCANTPLTPTCNNPTNMPNAGTCVPADCSTNCGTGSLICVGGVQMCNAVAATSDDTCDGNDDDCDMQIDEDWVCADPDGPDNIPGNADDCPCSATGQCNAKESCQNGAVVCQGEPVAQESCNCADDDCDGMVDENAASLCGAGATCTNCQCAFACVPGEFACPMGKICEGGFCITDPCFGVDCPAVAGDLQACRPQMNNPTAYECVSKCDTVQCASPNICHLPTGECKPDNCTTFPEYCQANQNCINGTCITNLCQGVTCPGDQYCVAGQCVGSCADVDCPAGQRCELGVCKDEGCDPPCPFGQYCQEESAGCIPDPCGFVVCPQGQWCNPYKNGVCEDDPCEIFDVQCADGEVCKGGTCLVPRNPDAGPEQHVTTGGGGGCSTGGDAGGSLLVGLGLVLLMRRRRVEGGAL